MLSLNLLSKCLAESNVEISITWQWKPRCEMTLNIVIVSSTYTFKFWPFYLILCVKKFNSILKPIAPCLIDAKHFCYSYTFQNNDFFLLFKRSPFVTPQRMVLRCFPPHSGWTDARSPSLWCWGYQTAGEGHMRINTGQRSHLQLSFYQ